MFLQIHGLIALCYAFIHAGLSVNTAMLMFQLADCVGQRDLALHAMTIIERFPHAVLNTGFLQLIDEDTLCAVLRSDALHTAPESLVEAMPEQQQREGPQHAQRGRVQAKSEPSVAPLGPKAKTGEMSLYEAMVRWGMAKCNVTAMHLLGQGQVQRDCDALAEVVARPMEHVRFGLMSLEELMSVHQSGLVRSRTILHAMAFKAKGPSVVPAPDHAMFRTRGGIPWGYGTPGRFTLWTTQEVDDQGVVNIFDEGGQRVRADAPWAARRRFGDPAPTIFGDLAGSAVMHFTHFYTFLSSS